jgi:hypothetical protein
MNLVKSDQSNKGFDCWVWEGEEAGKAKADEGEAEEAEEGNAVTEEEGVLLEGGGGRNPEFPVATGFEALFLVFEEHYTISTKRNYFDVDVNFASFW